MVTIEQLSEAISQVEIMVENLSKYTGKIEELEQRVRVLEEKLSEMLRIFQRPNFFNE